MSRKKQVPIKRKVRSAVDEPRYTGTLEITRGGMGFVIVPGLSKDIIIDKLTKALALGFVSRILGAIFGFLKVVVIFSFLLAIVSDYDLIDKNTQDESVLLKPIQEVSDLITPEINKHKTTILDKVEKSADEVKNKLNNSNSSE